MQRRAFWSLGLVLAVLILPAAAVTLVVSPVVVPSFALLHSGPHHPTSSSTNWAGYAVTGATHSVKFVKGSWIQPTATGCPATGSQYSSFWVGIDGFNSGTVEQTGTDSDCQSGTPTYYAWYEFYPAGSVLISSVPIHAGDTIIATVTYVSSTVGFTLFLKDNTTGHSFTHSHTVSGAQRTSAEWIAEAPASGITGLVLPLADFGTVHFGLDATHVLKSDRATVGTTTAAIGGFPSASINLINMINNAGTQTKAATSALTPDGTSFNVTWKHHGP